MNLMFKVFIFISSYTPLIIMIFLQNMADFSKEEFVRVFMINKMFWYISLFLILISILTLFIWLHTMKKNAEKTSKTYRLEDIKSHDGEILNYFITFIVPLLSLDISQWTSIVMNLMLVVIEGVYFIKNNNFHFNVLLIALGYRVYTDDEYNIIISKKDIYEIKNQGLEADQYGTTKFFYI